MSKYSVRESEIIIRAFNTFKKRSDRYEYIKSKIAGNGIRRRRYENYMMHYMKIKKPIHKLHYLYLDYLKKSSQTPVQKKVDETFPMCCICIDNINKDIILTRCGHVMCKGCTKRVIDKHLKCPYCRRTLNKQFDYIQIRDGITTKEITQVTREMNFFI